MKTRELSDICYKLGGICRKCVYNRECAIYVHMYKIMPFAAKDPIMRGTMKISDEAYSGKEIA